MPKNVVEPTQKPAEGAQKAVAAPVSSSRDLFSGRTIGLVISATVLVVVLAILFPSFTTVYTAGVVLTFVAFFVLIALSQAMCLVVGGMNLSVGAIGSICTVILGICMDPNHLNLAVYKPGLSPWLAVPVTLAAGGVLGLINGQLITKLKINSFIITLSMMFVYMGLRSGISEGYPYRMPDSFTFIGQKAIFGMVPYFLIVVVAVLALASYMFNNTVFGRRLLATGGNADAARLSGIDTDKMIVWANALSGILAALGAVLWASKQGTIAPGTGDDWLIVSFAVAIIGGTGLNGGIVSGLGIFMGGVIYELIKYTLVSFKINDNYSNSFIGVLILLAIIVDRVRETTTQRQKHAR